MTCNHAKINDSDRSDAANVDAADAHKSEKRVHNLTVDATQRNAGTSVILLTDLNTRQTGRQSSPDTYSVYTRIWTTEIPVLYCLHGSSPYVEKLKTVVEKLRVDVFLYIIIKYTIK